MKKTLEQLKAEMDKAEERWRHRMHVTRLVYAYVEAKQAYNRAYNDARKAQKDGDK
jgi:flagellar biosynthesis chaperone FliJ